jgi:hypothetical protein
MFQEIAELHRKEATEADQRLLRVLMGFRVKSKRAVAQIALLWWMIYSF